MEYVHQALKTSSEETVAKPTAAQQTLPDDFLSNGQGDDEFFVDNLLDFSEAPVLDEDQNNDECIKQDKPVVIQHEPAVKPEVKVEDLAGSVVPGGSDLCFPVISPFLEVRAVEKCFPCSLFKIAYLFHVPNFCLF